MIGDFAPTGGSLKCDSVVRFIYEPRKAVNVIRYHRNTISPTNAANARTVGPELAR